MEATPPERIVARPPLDPSSAPPRTSAPAAAGLAPLGVTLTGPHIRETFGFTAGAFGLAGLFVFVGMLVDSKTKYEVWHLPAVATIFLLAAGYEVFRRRHRLAFVPYGRDRVGVYRRGQLAIIASADDFVPYRLSIVQTLRQFVVFGFPAVVGSGLLLLFLSSSEPNVTVLLLFAGAAIGGLCGFVATAWSRVVCVQHVMQHAQHEPQTITLRRSDASKLLSPRPER